MPVMRVFYTFYIHSSFHLCNSFIRVIRDFNIRGDDNKLFDIICDRTYSIIAYFSHIICQKFLDERECLMKKMIAVFLLCFVPSFSILYWLAGGIWQESKKTPLMVIESPPNTKPKMKFPMRDQELELYDQHKIEDVTYYHRDEKTGNTDYLIRVAKATPLSQREVQLDKPICTYYRHIAKKNEKEIKAPDNYIVHARQGKGRLEDKRRRFNEITLWGDVIVRGYAASDDKMAKPLTTMRTEKIHAHLTDKTVDTDLPVAIVHKDADGKDALFINAVGMLVDNVQEKLIFRRQVKIKAKSSLWVKKGEKSKIAIDTIDSQSRGPAEFRYSKNKSKLYVIQRDQVKLRSGQALLLCDVLEIWLKRDQDSRSFEIKKLKATGNVVYEDGLAAKKNRATAHELLMETPTPMDTRITLTKNPHIVIHRLDQFSIVDAKTKARLRKEQERRQIVSLIGKSRDKIIWQRQVKVVGKTKKSRERFLFFGKAHLRQSTQKIKQLQLDCDRAGFLLVGEEIGDQQTRVPVMLKAYGHVVITHDRGQGRGDFFQWRRIDADRYRMILEGSPRVRINKIASGNAMPGKEIFSLGNEQTERQPKRQAVPEDMTIVSKGPMRMTVIRTRQGRILIYYSKDRVVAKRYQTGSDRYLGGLRCQKLFVVALPQAGVKNQQKQQQDQPKTQISYLQAEDDVKFASAEAVGGGDKMTFRNKNGANFLWLNGSAWMRNDQGKLTARRFYYDGANEIFWAGGGGIVKLDGKEMSARSRRLRYFRRKDQMELIGLPATIWQMENGRYKHILQARVVNYWRNSGMAKAWGNADLRFTTDDQGKKGGFLQNLGTVNQKKKDKTPTTGQGKTKKYRLKSRAIMAKFDSKNKQLQAFQALDNVRLKKIPSKTSPENEEAYGDRLIYRGNKAILYGKPARVHHDNNIVVSDKFTMFTENKRVICQGPARARLKRAQGQAPIFALPAGEAKPGQKTAPVYVSCQGPIDFSEQKQIELTKNVVVRMQEATLYCKRLLVLLEKQKVAGMVAHDDVKIVSGENVALADQLRWNEISGLALLIGYPVVELRSKDAGMDAPMVWYNIKQRRFFSRGKGIIIERLAKEEPKPEKGKADQNQNKSDKDGKPTPSKESGPKKPGKAPGQAPSKTGSR